jgi:hypothetical protein
MRFCDASDLVFAEIGSMKWAVSTHQLSQSQAEALIAALV